MHFTAYRWIYAVAMDWRFCFWLNVKYSFRSNVQHSPSIERNVLSSSALILFPNRKPFIIRLICFLTFDFFSSFFFFFSFFFSFFFVFLFFFSFFSFLFYATLPFSIPRSGIHLPNMLSFITLTVRASTIVASIAIRQNSACIWLINETCASSIYGITQSDDNYMHVYLYFRCFRLPCIR